MRRILIIGLGQVGAFLSGELCGSQEVVAVESDPELISKVKETQDILVFEGSGAVPAVLRRAEVEKADVVVAVTGDDKTNVLASLVARSCGVEKIVTTLRDPSYAEYAGMMGDSPVTVVSPGRIISEQVNALVGVPFAGRVEFFAGGKVELLKLRVERGAPVIDTKLKNLGDTFRHWIFVGVQRDNRITIPDGETELREGDLVFALGMHSALEKLTSLFNLRIEKINTVIIVGGGKVGCQTALGLHEKGLSVRLVESDREKARAAAEELLGVMVFEGDGTDLEVLREAGVERSDYLFALTGDDENNVLSALLGKNLGVERSMVLYSNPDYAGVLEAIGIDRAISVRMAVANGILGSLHLGGEANVSLLYEGEGEVLEFDVGESARMLGTPLGSNPMPRGSVIGVCVRDGKPIFPRGDFVAQTGDRLVVFSVPGAVKKVEEMMV